MMDGGEDLVEFGNTWGGDEVGSDVGMDIGEDKFGDVVGKEETVEMEFEFWDMGVGMICMWFEGVGPDGCMHVGMDVGEREDVVVSVEEYEKTFSTKCTCLKVYSFSFLKL